MKNILIIVFILTGFSAMAKDISVKVSGMVCSMCAQGIQKKFKKLKEVKKIEVDLDSKIVTIQTKNDTDINDELITKIITDAGYNVTEIKRQ